MHISAQDISAQYRQFPGNLFAMWNLHHGKVICPTHTEQKGDGEYLVELGLTLVAVYGLTSRLLLPSSLVICKTFVQISGCRVN